MSIRNDKVVLDFCKTYPRICYNDIFARLILEYAIMTWDPYAQRNINNIEAIQHQAARFHVRLFNL